MPKKIIQLIPKVAKAAKKAEKPASSLKTYKTTDGYTFYRLPEGKVVDNLDPEKVDMSWDSEKQFLKDMEGTAYEEGDELGQRRSTIESLGVPTQEKLLEKISEFGEDDTSKFYAARKKQIEDAERRANISAVPSPQKMDPQDFVRFAEKGMIRWAKDKEMELRDFLEGKSKFAELYLDWDDPSTYELIDSLESQGFKSTVSKQGPSNVTYLYRDPEDVELILRAQNPAQYGKAYGYSDEDIARFYWERGLGPGRYAEDMATVPKPEEGKASGGTLRKLSGLGTKAAETAKKAKAPPIKASEALGKHEGKTLMITEADRTKVGEGFLGGPGFSSLQLEDPFYGDVGAVWGVGKPSKASTMIAANKRLPEGEVIWSTFLGKPDQHKSNQMVFDSLLKEFKTANKAGKLSDELKQKINDRLADAVDKDGRPIFPADVDITSPKFRNLANTFDRRAVAASIMGGEGVGGKKGQIIDYESIIQSTTDPDLIEAPTGAVGNRLFTLSNEVLQRPDLHPAFPSILTGEDLGVNFSPVIRELIMRDYIKSMMETKGRMPGQFDYTRGYAPMQFIDEAILTKMQKEGYAEGGAVDAYQAQQQAQSKRTSDIQAYKEGKLGADELVKHFPGLTAAMVEQQLVEKSIGGPIEVKKKTGGEVKMQAGGGSRQAIQAQLQQGVPVNLAPGPMGDVARQLVSEEEEARRKEEAERKARVQAKPFSERFGGGYEAFRTLQSGLGRSLAAPFVALAQGEEAAKKFSEDIVLPETEAGQYYLEQAVKPLEVVAKGLEIAKIPDTPLTEIIPTNYIPGLGAQVAELASRTGRKVSQAVPPALKDLPVGMSIEAVGPEGKKLSVNDLIRMLEAGEEMTPEQRQKAEYSKAQKEKYAQANIARAQKEPAPKEELVKVPANESGFFSSVEKAAANLKREEGSGDAFLSDIMKFNPSAGELEATGIVQFLKGKKNVTRQEVADYINQNKIEIEEVIKGRDILSVEERNRLVDLERAISKGWYDIPQEELDWYEATKQRLLATPAARFDREGLVLPGGTNYKEILLKFKEKGERIFPTIEEWHNKNQKMPFSEVQKNPQLLESVIKQYEREKAAFAKNPNVYTSSHWPTDPNTFLHLRMQDMNIGGKKTLVIEEIQSDWHQEGRKKGYTQPGKEWEVFDPKDGKPIERFATEDEAKAYADKLGPSVDYAKSEGPPEAPYKKDWYQLGMKRVMKYAADNDYDQIALVGPEEQIRRGSLGTHVDGVSFDKNPDGSVKLIAEKGESVVFNDTVKPENLELYVGKDVAKKILESKDMDGTLTGDDLKIGGEGMRQYYDRNYPEVMNKLGRDYQTQAKKTNFVIKEFEPDDVEEVDIGEVDRFRRPVMGYRVRDRETGEEVAFEYDFEKALDEANKKAPSTSMWLMDLPSKMKSDVKIGQPFKKGGLVKKDEALANWHKAQTKGKTTKMSELIRFG